MTRGKTNIPKLLLAVFLAFVLVTGALILMVVAIPGTGGFSGILLNHRIARIKVGMTEESVLKKLGPPTTVTYATDKPVIRTQNVPEQTVQNKNKVYFYQIGMSGLGYVFFDEGDKVYLVVHGGT